MPGVWAQLANGTTVLLNHRGYVGMAALAFGAACVAANTLVYMRRRSRVKENETRPPVRDVLLTGLPSLVGGPPRARLAP